jgi:hypothetical protein
MSQLLGIRTVGTREDHPYRRLRDVSGMKRSIRMYAVVAISALAMIGAVLLPTLAASADGSDRVASASSSGQQVADGTQYAMAVAGTDVDAGGRSGLPYSGTLPVSSTPADISALLLAAAVAAALGVGVRVFQRRFAYLATR